MSYFSVWNGKSNNFMRFYLPAVAVLKENTVVFHISVPLLFMNSIVEAANV